MEGETVFFSTRQPEVGVFLNGARLSSRLGGKTITNLLLRAQALNDPGYLGAGLEALDDLVMRQGFGFPAGDL